MKITIGDAGSDATTEGEEPRWLLHGVQHTPSDPDWHWRQIWVGWGDVNKLGYPGWRYRGFVFYRYWHWGPFWVSSARLRRGLPPRTLTEPRRSVVDSIQPL